MATHIICIPLYVKRIPLYVLCCFVFVYFLCRPKLVVNTICINWLPIIINFSVILGSQSSPKLVVIVVVLGI